MLTSVVLSLLLGAGALAAPHGADHQNQNRNTHKEWTEGNKVFVEDTWVVSTTLPAGQHAQATPVAMTPVKVAQHNVVPSAASSKASVPTSAASGSGSYNINTAGSDVWSTSPKSMGKSILDSANQFRAQWHGLPPFTWDATLAANARSTAKDAIFTDSEGTKHNEGGANEMNHNLNPGSMAQCINEGDGSSMNGQLTPFENAWLGWLCEEPAGGIPCGQIGEYKQNSYKGMTDHAEIIKDTSYTKMGCYYQDGTQHPSFVGLWTCDFA